METNFESFMKSPSAAARQRVMDDLRMLAHDAEELLKATAGDVSEKTRETRARLTAALERAKATASHVQDEALATAKATVQKTDRVIREHPYESIGIAFGVGLLIGVLVSRR